jgi:putative copper export protein
VRLRVRRERAYNVTESVIVRRRALVVDIFHVAHVVLAGVWLGGLVFTTAVVSPAFGTMKWSEAERVAVRSAIGRQYARVGSVNLFLLALFAVLDGVFADFGVTFYAEYALLFLVFGLAATHGAYFGRRLAELAKSEWEAGNREEGSTFAARRRSLQRVSSRVSYLNLLTSTAVLVLAVGAQAG